MPITISYDRMPGYPKEGLRQGEIEIQDQFKCAYSDRITLAKELLGFVIGGTVRPPHQYDAGDDPLANLYVKAVGIEPIVSPDGTGSYQSAILTVNYGNLDYDMDSPPAAGSTTAVYVTESLEPMTEFLTLTHENLYWDVGANDEDKLEPTEAPTKILRMLDWVYTIHQLPKLPLALFTLPGKINDADIYSKPLDFTFPYETLLCGNPIMGREVTSEGTSAWVVTFRFTYKNHGTLAAPKGWNYFPKTKAAGAGITWSRLYESNDVEKDVYIPANFSNLIAQ